MAYDFSGKVALVTGAASGIGKATALAFARAKARVVVADLSHASSQKTVDLIQQEGGQGAAVAVDIANESSVRAMLDFTLKTYGQLDCAVNNAGILGEMSHLTADYPVDTFDKVIGVNLRGTWLCIHHEIPLVLKTGGTIVNTASMVGLIGMQTLSAYSTSKHGVVGMTRTAALEYAKQGIRINCVCPGGVRTPMAGFTGVNDEQAAAQSAAMSPNGRVAEPEEIADAILWLSSGDSSYVNGHALAVDAGFTVQ